MRLPYAFSLATRSLLREKWINLISILTIAAGLLIISVSFIVLYNVDLATRRLPEKFTMIVYLEPAAEAGKAERVAATLRSKPQVLGIKFISRDEALRELKSTLKNSAYILEGMEENPLPDSFEVKLRRDSVKTESAKQLADEIAKITGVAEVDYGEKFLSALHNVKNGVKITGILLVAVLSTGIVFVCYSTVKILFYRRAEEIETFKLLGATRGFIRAPFLIEGSVIGTGGGLICLLGMAVFYYVLLLRLSATLPIFKAVIFPVNAVILLPLVGMLLGLAGAAIAIGRIRYS
ncbi:MAG: permease-like cell division protein FtsX [Thermodesulfovibrionales bacterium]